MFDDQTMNNFGIYKLKRLNSAVWRMLGSCPHIERTTSLKLQTFTYTTYNIHMSNAIHLNELLQTRMTGAHHPTAVFFPIYFLATNNWIAATIAWVRRRRYSWLGQLYGDIDGCNSMFQQLVMCRSRHTIYEWWIMLFFWSALAVPLIECDDEVFVHRSKLAPA